MSFFERTDERDQKIFCIMCNVSMSERSATKHRMKCSEQRANEFKRDQFIRCTYDSGHILKPGELDDHLEFCTKYQNDLVADYQRQMALAEANAAGRGDRSVEDELANLRI